MLPVVVVDKGTGRVNLKLEASLIATEGIWVQHRVRKEKGEEQSSFGARNEDLRQQEHYRSSD